MTVVVSIGGSLVFEDKGPDTGYLKRLKQALEGLQVAVSIGGGKEAKKYVEAGRELGMNNFDLDSLAINVTYSNARLVATALDGYVFYDIDSAGTHMLSDGNMAVIGGTHPGHTTDAVSVLLAEKINAERWVNLSNVDGVYDKDPRKNKSAKKYSRMTHSKLVDLAYRMDKRGPRENFIIDMLAAKILQRSGIEAHFVDGRDMGQVRKAVLGMKHSGTLVKG